MNNELSATRTASLRGAECVVTQPLVIRVVTGERVTERLANAELPDA